MAWKLTPQDEARMRIEDEYARFMKEINLMPIELRDGDYVEADPEVKQWLLDHDVSWSTVMTAALLNRYIRLGVFAAEPLDKDLNRKILENAKGQSIKPNNVRKFRVKLTESKNA